MMKTLERMGFDGTVVEVYADKVPEIKDIIDEKVNFLKDMKRDDAFFVVDLNEIDWRHRQWKQLMPRIEPFYALKCNNDLGVARFIADLGMGFDCASKCEMEQVLDLGLEPEKIIFAHPCKPRTHIEYATRCGVDLMTFDDVSELDKIRKYSPNSRLILRIYSSKNFKVIQCLKKKFGCHPKNVKRVLQAAKNLNLNVVGVSFHVGNLPEEVGCFASAIEDAYHVFNVARELGFAMNVLDIGGGFPGSDTGPISFGQVAEVVTCALDEYFPSGSRVRIIAEPGRYFVSAAFTLAVNVIAKRVVYRDSENSNDTTDEVNGETSEKHSHNQEIAAKDDELHMYYVNDGIYGAFANIACEKVYPKFLQSKEETRWSCIWGPTCDGQDSVMEECRLPLMEVDEWIYFHNIGAYTVSLSCNFNGIPRPMRHFVCNEDVWIRIYYANTRYKVSEKHKLPTQTEDRKLGKSDDFEK